MVECNCVGSELDRFDILNSLVRSSRFQILHSCLRQAMIVHQANCRFGSCEVVHGFAVSCGDLNWCRKDHKTDTFLHWGAVGQSDYPSGAVRFAVDGRTLQVRQGQLGSGVLGSVLECSFSYFFPVEKQYRNWNTTDYLNFGVLVTLGLVWLNREQVNARLF